MFFLAGWKHRYNKADWGPCNEWSLRDSQVWTLDIAWYWWPCTKYKPNSTGYHSWTSSTYPECPSTTTGSHRPAIPVSGERPSSSSRRILPSYVFAQPASDWSESHADALCHDSALSPSNGDKNKHWNFALATIHKPRRANRYNASGTTRADLTSSQHGHALDCPLLPGAGGNGAARGYAYASITACLLSSGRLNATMAVRLTQQCPAHNQPIDSSIQCRPPGAADVRLGVVCSTAGCTSLSFPADNVTAQNRDLCWFVF